jgi:AAHS family 4-hydroxybenzoate transporter-like MFS transporter
LGDRVGRRTALIGCVAIFGMATLTTAFAQSLVGVSMWRLIVGMGTGGALPNVSALTAEFAPLRRRPTAVNLTLVCVPLGGMLGGALAVWVLPIFGWRGLYAIGGVLPLLWAIVLWAILPESPRFLARQPMHWPQLARLLTRIGHVIPAGSAFEDGTERLTANEASLRNLFSPGLTRETVGLPAMLTARGLHYETAAPRLRSTISVEFSASCYGPRSFRFSGRGVRSSWAHLVVPPAL